MSADTRIPYVRPPGIYGPGDFSMNKEANAHGVINPSYFDSLLGGGHRLPAGLDGSLKWISLTCPYPDLDGCYEDERRLQIAEGRGDNGRLEAMFVEQREKTRKQGSIGPDGALVVTAVGRISEAAVAGSRYYKDPETGLWRIDNLAVASDAPAFRGSALVSAPLKYPIGHCYFHDVPFSVQLMSAFLNRSGDIDGIGGISWQFISSGEQSDYISVSTGDTGILFPTLLSGPRPNNPAFTGSR